MAEHAFCHLNLTQWAGGRALVDYNKIDNVRFGCFTSRTVAIDVAGQMFVRDRLLTLPTLDANAKGFFMNSFQVFC